MHRVWMRIRQVDGSEQLHRFHSGAGLKMFPWRWKRGTPIVRWSTDLTARLARACGAFASGLLKDRESVFITTKVFHEMNPITLQDNAVL